MSGIPADATRAAARPRTAVRPRSGLARAAGSAFAPVTGPLASFVREALAYWVYLVPLALIAALALTVGAAFARTNGAFNSPDDASNFVTARAIVEEGRPWLPIPAGVDDEFDLLHPRAFVTAGGRALPIQSLVNPVSHAFFWKVSGTYATGPAVLFAVGLAGWTLAVSRLAGLRYPFALASVVLAMPVLYWLTRQFFSVSTYLVWLPWAVLALREGLRRPSLALVVASGALHGLALSARPDFMFAHALAFPIALGLTGSSTLTRRQWAYVAVHASVTGALFLGVALGTNAAFFGSPFTFGYDIARDNPGYDQPLTTGIPVLGTVLARAFPLGLASPGEALQLMTRYTALLAPVLIILAATGTAADLTGRRRRDQLLILGGLAAMVLYFAFSRASMNLQGSRAADPLPSHSVVRYCVPLYLVLGYFAARSLLLVGLRREAGRFAGGAVLGLAVLGIALSAWQVFFAFRGVSLIPWGDNLAERQATFTQIFGQTEPGSVIVSATYDKFAISSDRHALSWSTVGENDGFRPADVATTIARVFEAGAPVYVWDTREVSEPFATELCSRDLWLEQVQGRFFRVIRDPSCTSRLERLFRHDP
ncbi:MAG: hypothetical protein IT303_08535 [Dehalococcoidia bacterium]|nr:hypothetical protein [Dehalococcoidia bacterium]